MWRRPPPGRSFFHQRGGCGRYQLAVVRGQIEVVGREGAAGFILGYVEKHYMENIYLKTIAEEAGLSYAYVSHYFSERQGVGFADYLNSVRIQKACEMLAHTRLSLQEIAMRVGFGSMNTFMRNMKKFAGTTPDAYRKLHSEA